MVFRKYNLIPKGLRFSDNNSPLFGEWVSIENKRAHTTSMATESASSKCQDELQTSDEFYCWGKKLGHHYGTYEQKPL
jgi:hypothetical protein